MKAVFLLGLLVSVAVAKNLPQKPRTFGNFGPDVPRSFKSYKANDQIVLNLADPVDAAVEFFTRTTGFPAAQTHIASYHTAGHNGVTHVYLQQIVNGLQVVNGVANVNVGRNGQILSIGNSFFNGPAPKSSRPLHSIVDVQQALEAITGSKPGKLNTEFPASLKYINNGESLVLAWDLVYETEDNMYNAIVDATTNTVVQLVDWVSDAAYTAYPLGINDPLSGDREVIVDPAHPVASPLGWHSQGDGKDFTDTQGNNVFAQENTDGTDDWENNYRPDGGADLIFDPPLDLSEKPAQYLDASITNLFYWNNEIHDLFYVYGFDEVSGNFQQNNFGRGGLGNDGVIANAQDGSGYNNANFMTPPDGSQGRMRMYIWTLSLPFRDSALDGGIMMHEYLHGISLRLTGGPSNVNCLQYGEPGGMGEGWGDTFATITRVTAETTRAQVYQMGDYSNGGTGIRNYPYSTDMEVNPSTYAYITRPGYGGVHDVGEVWAVMLYEVFWNMVESQGFQSDWFDVEAANPGGNIMFFQNVIDGMKIQPCMPTFVDARDAILQADENNYGGVNACAIWRGFAKRGLGVGALSYGKENFDIPAECQ